jgi:hypothetical protein
MNTDEISGSKPAASGDAAMSPLPASAPDASATPRMALASVLMPTIETPVGETPPIALVSVEAPRIAPDSDEIKPPLGEEAMDRAADDPIPEPPEKGATPRVSRFTLLAATLALAAALGGMVGALVAYGLARPGAAPAVAAGRTDLEELQALKENVVQARVELAALKVSLDSAARNANAQFTRIGERVDRLERTQGEPAAKLSKAIETLERLSRDAAPSKEVTGSVAPLPSRPGAVEGWVLRDARRGTALIEGRVGVIEVEQGDMVPGLGRVEAVRKQDGRWVVVTSKGLIMPPR